MLDFIRVATAVPPVTVGDAVKNTADICKYIADADEKKAFYEFTLALDALKASLNGDEKTVILDEDSELAKILMGITG